jgi:hypothetical protein
MFLLLWLLCCRWRPREGRAGASQSPPFSKATLCLHFSSRAEPGSYSNGRPHSSRQLVATVRVCSNLSNIPSDCCFMSPLLWVLLLTEKTAAVERNQVSTKATRRRATFPTCSNHSNMSIHLCFMFRYTFAIVVVVLGASDRVLAGKACGLRSPTRFSNCTYSS